MVHRNSLFFSILSNASSLIRNMKMRHLQILKLRRRPLTLRSPSPIGLPKEDKQAVSFHLLGCQPFRTRSGNAASCFGWSTTSKVQTRESIVTFRYWNKCFISIWTSKVSNKCSVCFNWDKRSQSKQRHH